jgi:glycosyltransferase involved in cell wall biosynthesis
VLADPVRRFGGGRIAPAGDAAATAGQIAALLAVARHPSAAPDPAALRSHLTAAEDYRTRVYRPAPSWRDPSGLPCIGIVADRGLGTTEVRTGRQARAAEDLGLAVIRWADAHDVATGGDDTAYDAVVVQRASVPGPDAEGLIARLGTIGARLVLEVDDDLVTPEARARLRANFTHERLDALAAIARAADHVIASTPHLAGVMRGFVPGAHLAVIENRLDPRAWFTALDDGKPRADRRPVYVGTSTHGADLALLEGVPALVGEILGRRVEFDVVGVTSGPLPQGFRRVGNPRTQYGHFVPWLRRQSRRWSIGLAPLADDPFNRSKSDLKLLEYAALGLAAVASRRGPYAAVPDLAITVDDDVTSWATAVASLLRNDRWRRAAAAAHATVQARRSIDRAWVEHWIATICGFGAES